MKIVRENSYYLHKSGVSPEGSIVAIPSQKYCWLVSTFVQGCRSGGLVLILVYKHTSVKSLLS